MKKSSIALLLLFFLCHNNWDEKKEKMIKVLIEYGIKDKKVLSAMREVPRHEFVKQPYTSFAYDDTPLPIGFRQTISQPYIVALMTELLEPGKDDVVLEIGTGSGYQAAVLAKLVKEVYTVEIIDQLCHEAKKRLETLGFSNVYVICGDGFEGYPEKAPFDKIIITAAPEKIPEKLVEQLKEGGIMVAPVGRREGVQYLYKFYKKNKVLHETKIIPVRFVPMVTGEEIKAGK